MNTDNQKSSYSSFSRFSRLTFIAVAVVFSIYFIRKGFLNDKNKESVEQNSDFYFEGTIDSILSHTSFKHTLLVDVDTVSIATETTVLPNAAEFYGLYSRSLSKIIFHGRFVIKEGEELPHSIKVSSMDKSVQYDRALKPDTNLILTMYSKRMLEYSKTLKAKDWRKF